MREAADQAHARSSSARAGLLRAVSELERTGAWQGDGAGNLPAWLSARWQISARTARELVREAGALRERPALQEALGRGEISHDQCKALVTLTREGTDDDAVWLDGLSLWSVHELEREARKAVARELERKDGGVYLRMQHTPDERYLRGEFQLHPEDGAAVMAAIDARVSDGTALRDWDHASALALVELVTDAGTSRPMVLLSTDETALRTGSDVARVGSNGFVGAQTARRFACDASVQPLHRDADGRVVATGRTSRTVPAALRRAVEERDGGVCTFPGCGRDRFLECHHIVHFADGGPTELGNLLLTCWRHHHLLHEGEWSVRGDPGPGITWVRPNGEPFEPRVRVVLDTS